MKQQLISVILPAYNEKGNVIPLMKVVHEILKDYPHEILLVDDNSPDGTYETVKGMNLDYVTPILRTKDKGLAKSIRCGLENATGDILIVMDSDFNHRPEYLPFMIESLSYYDCISASRFVYGGKMDKRSRHLMSWAFNIFVRVMTGGEITDSLYGYFSIKKDKLDSVDFDKVFWGFGDYCIRLFYYLQRGGINMLQFPAVNGARKEGLGNSRFFKVFWLYFRGVIKLAYQIRIRKNV